MPWLTQIRRVRLPEAAAIMSGEYPDLSCTLTLAPPRSMSTLTQSTLPALVASVSSVHPVVMGSPIIFLAEHGGSVRVGARWLLREADVIRRGPTSPADVDYHQPKVRP